MPYIDKEKFRMHIIMYQANLLKVRLTDKKKENFIRMLDEVPTADVVERKTGEWIEHERAEEVGGYLISNYECSCCHTLERSNSNYCPHCGADMRGR